MTLSTQIKPIIQISKILSSLVRKVDTLWSGLNFRTKFANSTTNLSSINPSVQRPVTNFISSPVRILFFQSPNINFSSNPRFMTNSSLISKKTFRNLFLTFSRRFVELSTPDKVTITIAVVSAISLAWFENKFGSTGLTEHFSHIFSIAPFFIRGATLTVYPDPNPESTSVDGWAQRDTVVETWATIIAGAGNNSTDTDATGNLVAFNPDTTTGNWTLLRRFIMLFDTSALPDTANISAGVLSVEGNSKLDVAGLAPTIDVYTSTPASNTAIVNADFTQTGATSQTGSPMAYATWSTTGFNNFTFNATGIGNISKTGVSKFALRNANYDADGTAPTWGATARVQFTGYSADQAGTGSDPKLVVTYTTTRIKDVIMGGVVVRKR